MIEGEEQLGSHDGTKKTARQCRCSRGLHASLTHRSRLSRRQGRRSAAPHTLPLLLQRQPGSQRVVALGSLHRSPAMPLVLFVGHPASGKTRRATQLVEHLRGDSPQQRHQDSTQLTDDRRQHSSPPSPPSAPPSSDDAAAVAPSPVSASSPSHPVSSAAAPEVVLINLESLQLSRAAVYSSATSEKAARSALRTAVERLLTSSRLLILDELNGIKGFRYELWCRAREMGTTYCVVHVDTPPATCRLWNSARPEQSRYSEAALTDLLQRLETPNGSKRWDAPLFTVTPEQDTPLQDIAQWLLYGKRQTPGLATLPASLEDASYLQRLERVLSSVTQELVRLQQSGLSSAGDELQVKGSRLRLQLVRPLHYPELKRVQAQFSKMARQSSSSLQTDDDIATSYIQHLQNALNY